jgi:hypothetical protein
MNDNEFWLSVIAIISATIIILRALTILSNGDNDE